MDPKIRVSCPACRRRLAFRAPTGEALRLKVRCSACEHSFVVRRRPSQAELPSVGGATPWGETVSPTTTPRTTAAGSPVSTGGGSNQGPFNQVSFNTGDVLAGRYLIARFIAQGGMGEVYEAEDLELRERVAVKVVRPEVARDVSAIDRFKREIQLARKVTHPNVCRIFDVFHHPLPQGGTVTFLTMELLDGETLSDRLSRSGAMSPQQALPIVKQLTEGLHAAHRVGIIHRDFKSQNVVLETTEDGVRAVITDFGLARGEAGDDSFGVSLTIANAVIGTPAYMAPEQVEGGTITAAADLYALGVVLYELVTGEVPFKGENALSTATKRLHEAPPSPRVYRPQLAPRWERAIMKCLAREPNDRFGSAPAVHESLLDPPTEVVRSVPGPSSVPAPGASAEAPKAAAGKTRRESSMVAALCLVILLIGLVGFWRYRDWQARQPLVLDDASLLEGAVRLRPSLAVLGFGERSGSDQDAWLATALGEMLTAELGTGGRLRVVPGKSVAEIRPDLAFSAGESPSLETLASVRGLLAADYIVSGSFEKIPGDGGESLDLEVVLHDAANGQVVSRVQEVGDAGSLYQLAHQLGGQLFKALDAGPLPAGAGAARAGLPTDARAAELYARGLAALHERDHLSARDLLEDAVAADPNNPMARSALADAWQELGYRTRAREEAAKAFEVSTALPQEDRLWIEAQYRELDGQWQSAATLYRTIWHANPDDFEVGLRVVEVQSTAGQGKLALQTLEVLRRIGTSETDPRFDLAEAQAAQTISDFALQQRAAARAAEKAIEQGAPSLLARARVTEGGALRNLGRFQEAADLVEAGLNLFQQSGNSAGTALALTTFGTILFDQGNLEGARRRFESAQGVYRQLGDQASLARSQNNLGLLAKQQGDPDSALALYEESLELCREIGNELLEAYALNNMAGLLSERGKLGRAVELFQEVLAIRKSSGDRAGEAYALDNLGSVLRKMGDLGAADPRHREALALRQSIGHRSGEAATLLNLGRLSYLRGELPEARDFYKRALEISDEINSQSLTARGWAGQGEVFRAEGDLEAAEGRHRDAWDLRQSLGEASSAAESLVAVAEILLEQEDFLQAQDFAHQAVEEYRRTGLDDGLAQGLSVLARSFVSSRELDTAGEAVAEARGLSLASENLEVRSRVALAAASLHLALKQPARALEELVPVLQELKLAGLAAPSLEVGRMTCLAKELDSGGGTGSFKDCRQQLEIDAGQLGAPGLVR